MSAFFFFYMYLRICDFINGLLRMHFKCIILLYVCIMYYYYSININY